jgi:hypothetical protein
MFLVILWKELLYIDIIIYYPMKYTINKTSNILN